MHIKPRLSVACHHASGVDTVPSSTGGVGFTAVNWDYLRSRLKQSCAEPESRTKYVDADGAAHRQNHAPMAGRLLSGTFRAIKPAQSALRMFAGAAAGHFHAATNWLHRQLFTNLAKTKNDAEERRHHRWPSHRRTVNVPLSTS